MPSAEEALTAILLLLPGFIASLVFGSLYPPREKSDFEKTLESLAFTLVILAVWGFLGGRVPVISQGRIHSPSLLGLAGIAVAFGAVSAWLARTELLHRALAAIIGEASAPGPDDVFWRTIRDHAPTWVIAHLKESDDVLLGAVKYLGMSGEHRALFLERVRLMDSEFNDRGLVQGPGVIVPLDQIKMLELYSP